MNQSCIIRFIIVALTGLASQAFAAAPKSAADLLAQDEQLAAMLAMPARWSALPAFVRDVKVDASGRPWFIADATSTTTDKTLRDSVERAASGKLPLIRGGKLLLVDRAGRFWVAPISNSKVPHLLQCYDGKQWLEPRSATGEGEPSTRTSTSGRYRGEFWDCGFEDSAGNVYFIGGSFQQTGWGVHRRTPAGEWSWHKFSEPRKNENILLSRPDFFEQAGGRVIICPRGREGGDIESHAKALLFDGQKWDTIDPHVCGNEDHSLTVIAPMPDGSIASICNRNRIWFRWPEQKLELTQEAFNKLTDDLNNDDLDVRDRASEKLVQLARHAKPLLDKVNSDDLPPEARVRIDYIRKTIESSGGEDHDVPLLYGGRFMFDYARFVARRLDGSLQLYVKLCKDLRDGKLHDECFLLLDTKGKWRIEPIPSKQWDAVGALPGPEFRFRDSRGGIWLRDAMRTEPDNSAVPIAPDGFTFDRAFTEDKDARIYAKGERLFVFDPAQPEAKGELGLQTFTQFGMAYRPRERVAWGVKNDTWPHELLCFGRGNAVQTVPRDWKDSGIEDIYPLKGDASIVHLFPRPLQGKERKESPIEPRLRLWDGNAWTIGDGEIRDFVQEHAELLCKLAPNRLDSAGVYGRSTYRISSDGAGGLWFWQYNDGRSDVTHHLQHFDGKIWRDAWPALGVANPAEEIHWPIASAHGGKSILMHDRSAKSLYLLRLTPDGFKKVPLSSLKPPPPHASPRDLIEDASGDLWYRTDEHPFPLARIRPDGVELGAPSERPLFADVEGNVWSYVNKDGSLRVFMGEKEVALQIHGLSSSSAMTSSPDGRVWLLHHEALSELRADRVAGAVTEIGRWKWATPMNDFRTVFCDDSGGLWIEGHGNRKTRFALPAPHPQIAPTSMR